VNEERSYRENGLSNEEVAEIYRRYGHLLLRRCRTRVRDDAAAEDVLQESFVKIMKYGGAYRTAATKLRWLYQVVDNSCYDALARRREVPCEPDQLESRAGAYRSSPTTRIQARRALARLAERERRVAVLGLVEGLSQDEIAAEIGWSRQTVNKKLREIRVRLGRWLRGD
jgi:RNA polymerase sigma-70 factor, ECF subfamily